MKQGFAGAGRAIFNAFASLGVSVTVIVYRSGLYDPTSGKATDSSSYIEVPNAQKGVYKQSAVDGARIQMGDFPLYVLVEDLDGHQIKAKHEIEINRRKHVVVSADEYAQTYVILQCREAK